MLTDPIDLHSFPANNLYPEIVSVLASDDADLNHARFAGTAHCFDCPPWLLTAAHILAPGKHFHVSRPQRAEDNAPYLTYPVTSVQIISGYDAALLHVPDMVQRRGSLSLSSGDRSSPTRADDVWTFGFPLTEDTWDDATQSFTCHLVGRYLESYVTRVFLDRQTQQEGTPTIEIAHVLPPGISGAPVLQRTTQKIVGIARGTQWTQYEGQSYGYGTCVPIWAIYADLRRVISSFVPPGS